MEQAAVYLFGPVGVLEEFGLFIFLGGAGEVRGHGADRLQTGLVGEATHCHAGKGSHAQREGLRAEEELDVGRCLNIML